MSNEAQPRPDDGVGRRITHASFFSGVGGLDQGLERAGFETVSFSEIEPYAIAVLARHWPDIPNLGDITHLAGGPPAPGGRRPRGDGAGDPDWASADLFSGGFPCQDLSIAGRRAGFRSGKRSVLAFAFLDLVARHRPRAVLLENVPGLLSSHRGRDLGALLGAMVELGYGVAYRVLDARFFGVPQRRKRVFIVALRSGDDDPDGRLAAERAAAVLAVGTRCPRHPPAGYQAEPEPAGGPRGGPDRYGVDYVGSWQAGPHGHHGYDQAAVQGHLPVLSHAITTTHTRTGRLDPNGETFVVGAPADPGRDGAPDGLARRMDDRPGLEGATVVPISSDALRGEGEARSPSADAVGNVRLRDPGLGIGDPGDPAFSVTATDPGAVAYSITPEAGQGSELRATEVDVAPGLAAVGHGLSDRGVFVKSQRAREVDGHEKWIEDDVSPTLNVFDNGDSRAVTLVAETQHNSSHAADMDTYVVAATLNSGERQKDGGFRTEPGEHLTIGPAGGDDPMLPLGLDSHRYRCCGNGVVSSVAEWIGHRLYAELSTP